MTLKEIKEQYAKEKDSDDWSTFILDYGISDDDVTEISKRYSKAKLEEAAARAKLKVINNGKYDAAALNNFLYIVDKESITNTPLD